MNKNLKHWLLQIFATKIGWLALSLLSTLVFGIIANYHDWAETVMFISLAYPVGLLLVMMVFAFIINPIREYKENKK